MRGGRARDAAPVVRRARARDTRPARAAHDRAERRDLLRVQRLVEHVAVPLLERAAAAAGRRARERRVERGARAVRARERSRGRAAPPGRSRTYRAAARHARSAAASESATAGTSASRTCTAWPDVSARWMRPSAVAFDAQRAESTARGWTAGGGGRAAALSPPGETSSAEAIAATTTSRRITPCTNRGRIVGGALGQLIKIREARLRPN